MHKLKKSIEQQILRKAMSRQTGRRKQQHIARRRNGKMYSTQFIGPPCYSEIQQKRWC